MPVPRIDVPVYTVSEDENKLDVLEIALQKQGYSDCENPRDMIKIIDLFGLDTSQFDFPYGSYEAFKTHVLSGEYDDMFDIDFTSKEKFEAMKRDIEEGRACI